MLTWVWLQFWGSSGPPGLSQLQSLSAPIRVPGPTAELSGLTLMTRAPPATFHVQHGSCAAAHDAGSPTLKRSFTAVTHDRHWCWLLQQVLGTHSLLRSPAQLAHDSHDFHDAGLPLSPSPYALDHLVLITSSPRLPAQLMLACMCTETPRP